LEVVAAAQEGEGMAGVVVAAGLLRCVLHSRQPMTALTQQAVVPWVQLRKPHLGAELPALHAPHHASTNSKLTRRCLLHAASYLLVGSLNGL
jgi:hypothetical protein